MLRAAGSARPINLFPIPNQDSYLQSPVVRVDVSTLPEVALRSAPSLTSAQQSFSGSSASETTPQVASGSTTIQVTQRDIIRTTHISDTLQSSSSSSSFSPRRIVSEPLRVTAGLSDSLTELIAVREDNDHVLDLVKRYLEQRSNREGTQYQVLELLLSSQHVLKLTPADIAVIQTDYQTLINSIQAVEAAIGRAPRPLEAICLPYREARAIDISRIEHMNLSPGDRKILFIILQTQWLRQELRVLQNGSFEGHTIRVPPIPEVAFTNTTQLTHDVIKLSNLQDVRACCEAVFSRSTICQTSARIKIMKHFDAREDYTSANILTLVSEFTEFYCVEPNVFIFSTLSSTSPQSKGVMTICFCGIKQKEYRLHECAFCCWFAQDYGIQLSDTMVIVNDDSSPQYKPK